MKTYKQYTKYKKPAWAPPSWLFAPVWTILYILIFLSFGYVFLSYVESKISFLVIMPFILNLIFNLSFTYLQFNLKNYILASVDIVLTWITIILCMFIIFPFAPWITYLQIPYFLWVSFATILQLRITYLNTDPRVSV